jgi:hypothetical protein
MSSEKPEPDEEFLSALLEPLRDEPPTPPPGIVARALRRVRLEILLRDLLDLVWLHLLGSRRDRDSR